ncbi:hypothetical protein [Costertonia aggregata]|uniref:Uncharacterized protein n=1 Tax=Costertonia aggregata TaxID=343403 RepID=A0A7H9AT68_9FLAO|nr:hypothetical protein [Costertonia aggregata]QLG46542.1 hypothetical protein HYG79_14695 [Costertonia aggregata]
MKNQQFAKVGAVREKILISENELLIYDSVVVKQDVVASPKKSKIID